MTITKNIRYIGVDDTTLDLFEGQYLIPNGISYNSYLILDEKVAIMDTVDARKGKKWWENLETALEGRTPDYLVVQHMEPDHASLVAEVAQRYPNLQVVATQKAIQMFPLFFEGADFLERCIAVKEGDKERIQAYEGVVIAKKGSGIRETFTVRRLSFGIGVERTFPMNSPRIDKVVVVRKGKVRRAKIYYIRDLSGKAAKVKEDK